MTEDLIELMADDAKPGSFAVAYDIQLPEDLAAHLKRADELRAVATESQAAAAAEVRLVAAELHHDGVPLRDIGRILGVSYQRAHQLVRGQDPVPSA